MLCYKMGICRHGDTNTSQTCRRQLRRTDIAAESGARISASERQKRTTACILDQQHMSHYKLAMSIICGAYQLRTGDLI